MRLSDREVSNLIRIADARITWDTRFLGIPIPRRYNLKEQLEVIRSLGESGSARALEYLRKINHSEEWRVNSDASDSQGDYGGISYPNARGSLGSKLSSGWCSGPNAQVDPEMANYEQNPEVARLLNQAIEKLEESQKD